MVIHQVQVRCRPGKVRRSETDVLPLSYMHNYTTNCVTVRVENGELENGMEKRHSTSKFCYLICTECSLNGQTFLFCMLNTTNESLHTGVYNLRWCGAERKKIAQCSTSPQEHFVD